MKRFTTKQIMLLAKRVTSLTLFVVMALNSGCNPQIPKFLGPHNKNLPLDSYLDVYTQIEYPDAETVSTEEVRGSQAPLTINNSEGKEIVDISLEEAIRCGLYNSQVIRDLGGVSYGPNGASGAPGSLLQNPTGASTIYNPAITETDGRYGVEAVLADFDTQWNSSLYAQRNYNYNNQVGYADRIRTKGVSFQTEMQKTNATGGTWTARFTGNYTGTDPFTNLKQGSYFEVGLETEVRQPLLRGAGVQFNRIAGPGAIPGFYNGVMIARIRTDISLVDFETSIRNFVADVERAYWELYFAYRRLDSVVVGRDSALQTWRQAQAKYEASMKGGSAQERAQAQQQYYMFKGSVESALNALYKAEADLRYIMGLTVADGRLFRPSDEPSVAKINFDWCDIHAETMSRNVELRRQKWVIKQSELELLASKNFLLPRLDLVASGGVSGANGILLDPRGHENSAFGSMTHDGYWNGLIGMELSVPIGFRRERASVRNAELVLARNRALLQEQELEVTHKLGYAVRELEDNYVLSQTYFNRRVAAQTEVEATTSAYETGTMTLNLVLDAQRRLAEAEIDFFRSVIDYNLALVDIHTQKGSLLEYDGVVLMEGPWTQKAYFDAQRLAKMRDKALYLNYGFTRPNVITEGAYRQHTGMADPANPVTQARKAGEFITMETGEYGMQNAVLPTEIIQEMPVQAAPVMGQESGPAPSILEDSTGNSLEVIPTPPPVRTSRAVTGNQVTRVTVSDENAVTGLTAPAPGKMPAEKNNRTFITLNRS
ncbi:MAG: TolC family protein [Planctomycetia bacterium]|nr:TolC family protein [Planctomycetia bacterium]